MISRFFLALDALKMAEQHDSPSALNGFSQMDLTLEFILSSTSSTVGNCVSVESHPVTDHSIKNQESPLEPDLPLHEHYRRGVGASDLQATLAEKGWKPPESW